MKQLNVYGLFLCLAFSALLGCSGGEGGNKVTGTVKFSDGTPLTRGTVTFTKGDFSTFGNISSDGTVEVGKLDGGVPDGSYTATVVASSEGTGVDGDYGGTLVKENKTTIEVKGSMTGDNGFTIEVEKP